MQMRGFSARLKVTGARSRVLFSLGDPMPSAASRSVMLLACFTDISQDQGLASLSKPPSSHSVRMAQAAEVGAFPGSNFVYTFRVISPTTSYECREWA
jgi:hypothetical protein